MAALGAGHFRMAAAGVGLVGLAYVFWTSKPNSVMFSLCMAGCARADKSIPYVASRRETSPGSNANAARVDGWVWGPGGAAHCWLGPRDLPGILLAGVAGRALSSLICGWSAELSGQPILERVGLRAVRGRRDTMSCLDMAFSRNTESLIRQLLELMPLNDVPTPEALLASLQQL